MTKKINSMREELRQMAEKEAMRVWRLGRRAKAKGCSQKLINEIRDEGFSLYNEYTAYPERLLDNNAKHRLKYAFCGERMKHHYLVINGDNEIVRVEYR